MYNLKLFPFKVEALARTPYANGGMPSFQSMVSHLTLGAECAVAAVEGADHPAARRARLGGGQRPLVDVVDVADHVPQLRRDELAGRVRARERIWI